MTPSQCPELEVLFTELEASEGPALEHAASCPLCSAVLEEHRQQLQRVALDRALR